jgi:hypothetical protein
VLKVWDLVMATEVATLRTQLSWVTDLAFSSNGARLVSCSIGIQGMDNVARLWETEVSPDVRRSRAVAMRAYAAVREVIYRIPASPQAARDLIASDQYLPQNVKDFAADHFESLLPHPEKIVMLVQSLVRAQPASAEVRRGAAEWFALVTKVAPEYLTLDEVLAQP